MVSQISMFLYPQWDSNPQITVSKTEARANSAMGAYFVRPIGLEPMCGMPGLQPGAVASVPRPQFVIADGIEPPMFLMNRFTVCRHTTNSDLATK